MQAGEADGATRCASLCHQRPERVIVAALGGKPRHRRIARSGVLHGGRPGLDGSGRHRGVGTLL